MCATAFNELELRTHNTIEKMENEGWDLLLLDRTEKFENLIDSMNTVKLMYAVGDTRMGNYVYERVGENTYITSSIWFIVDVVHFIGNHSSIRISFV